MKRKLLALSLALSLVGSVFLDTSIAFAGTENYTGSVADDDKGAAEDGILEDSDGDNLVDIGTTVNLTHYGDAIIYSVAVEWGTMEFTYDYGAVWNPATHKYDTSASKMVKGGWLATDYKAANNGIKVTNNSNYPITAEFEYRAGYESIGAVTGVFSTTNSADAFATAYNGGLPLANSIAVDLDICSTYLTSTKYWGLNTPGDYNKFVYFAYQGKPDKIVISGETPNSDGTYSKTYTDVGSVQIKISPCEASKVKAYNDASGGVEGT